MKRFAKTAGWAIVASVVAGIGIRGEYWFLIHAVRIAAAICVAWMLVAAAISFAPRLRRDRMIAGQIALAAFLCIPLMFGTSACANELGRQAIKRYVERRAARMEQLRRERGAYPRDYATPFGDRITYATDGRAYTVSWNDRLTCGRSMAYHSSTRQWVERYRPCYF